MGNTCRGSFGGKNFQGFDQPQDQSKSKKSSRSDHSSSDYSPSTLNSQQLVAQEFATETPKKGNNNSNNNLQHNSAAKKDTFMRRGIDNQPYFVLGHKTENIRDLYVLGRKLGKGSLGPLICALRLPPGLSTHVSQSRRGS